MSRQRGDEVALRSVRMFGCHGRAVTFAVAGIVVADGPDVVAVATLPGADLRLRAGTGSGPNSRIVLPNDWDGTYVSRAWHGNAVVRVHRWGEPWSIWRWHDGRSWTNEWYGNLETPWTRSSTGYDTDDWTLDVIASGTPGTPSWAVGYKDEDELAWRVSISSMTAQRAESIRQTGAHLMTIAASGSWPFDASWDDWIPDSAWLPNRLPPGWERASTSEVDQMPKPG